MNAPASPTGRRARATVLALVVALASGCGDGGCCGAGGPAAGTTASAPLPPLPAPADLAVECVLPTPDESWEKARAQIGGAAAFLPRSAGGLVAVTLHFPMAVSEAIDGRSPAVCAASLANEPGAVPRFVTGIHLRWPDRLLDGLTKGAEARFDAVTDPATHIEVLKARDPKDAVMAAGVLGHYLLVAARAEDLTALGPYVARTMPTRAKDFPTSGVRLGTAAAPGAAPPPEPVDLLARVPAAALGGPIAAATTRTWTRLTERLAEKLPIPAPFTDQGRAALAVLPDLEGAELRVILGERSTRIEATAPLRKGSPGESLARSLATGDLAPLLALPGDTLAAALLRRALTAGGGTTTSAGGTTTSSGGTTTSAGGTTTSSGGTATSAGGTATVSGGSGPADQSVTARAAALIAAPSPATSGTADASDPAAAATTSPFAKLLGVSEAEDAAKLDGIARAFEAARGDWITAGFSFDGTGPSAFVRAAVRDGSALDAALADFLAIVDRASPRDPVRGQKLDVMSGKTVLENIPGDVYRLRLARGGDGAKKAAGPPLAPTDTPTAVDLLFRRSDDVFVAATGYASRDVLRALLTAPTGENMRGVAEIAAPLDRLGGDVALAAFVDPARISASRAGKPGSATPAPVVLALGRTTGDTVTLFARLEASSVAIAELARWLDP